MLKDLEHPGKMLDDPEHPKHMDTSAMNEEELVNKIRQVLRQKRYLIVFDDVWQDDFWTKIGNVFHKDDDRRSRILFTTRDEKVALSVARKDRVMSLALLEEEEAWSLFCKKAFWQDPMLKCPPDLEDWARRIVGKCKGLPLAIVAAAGMMSRRQRDASVWERSYRMLSSEFSDKRKLSILMHSYYDLPSYLKQCFLYCSFFPEDWIFYKTFLIRYWVAEGFVEGRDDGLTLEEVAEGYLQELIERSMIQEEDKVLEWYKMHNIFRMIALNVSQEQKFGSILDEDHQASTDVRRLSICKMVDKIPSGVNVPKLRSLFVRTDITNQFSFADFKLVKVLDLEGTPITDIPKEIFDFFNLRHLNLSRTRIKADVFPSKIERLQNLLLLDLYDTNVKQLPWNVVQLQKLRRLYFGNYKIGHGFQAPKDIWHLMNLKSLHSIEANEKLVEQLGQFTCLLTLGITKVKHLHEKPLCNTLKRMGYLKRLAVHVAIEDLIDLEYLNSPPPRLQDIQFYGRLKNIPTWFRSLNNLRTLQLVGTKLQEGNQLCVLRSLPCLAFLNMEDAYEGTKLSFPPNCFPALKSLYIHKFGKLTSIEIDEAALPVLHGLWISDCWSLTCPVPQVQNLHSLKELILERLDPKVVQDLQEICTHCNNVKLHVWRHFEDPTLLSSGGTPAFLERYTCFP